MLGSMPVDPTAPGNNLQAAVLEPLEAQDVLLNVEADFTVKNVVFNLPPTLGVGN